MVIVEKCQIQVALDFTETLSLSRSILGIIPQENKKSRGKGRKKGK